MLKMSKLKNKAIIGIFWSGTEKFFQQILKFVFYVLLARILEPRSFGLIGMLSIFLAVSQTFIDSGLGNALIQKKDRNNKDYSTVFIFNLSMSVFFYLVLFILSPVIASFYKQPELIKVLRILSLILIINGFFLVQIIKLRIELNFKKQANINIVAIFFSGLISVSLAIYGFGVWSLVVYQLLQSLIKAILYNLGGVPRHGFHKDSFKKLFNYGSKLLITSLINNVFYNIYNLVIGKAFNAIELGFYERAKKLQAMVIDNINSTIQLVSFPFMSQFQEEESKLTLGYTKILGLLGFLNFPLMFFLILSAKPLILVILSSKWEPSIPFLQLLAIVGLLYPIHALNMNILEVKGRTDILLKLEIVKKIIVVILIAISIKFGIKGLIIGQIISSIIAFFINTHYGGNLVKIGFIKQVIILSPYLLLTSLSYLITLLLTKSIKISNFFLIFVNLFTFFTIYFISAKIFKMRAYKEIMQNLKELRNEFKKGK